MKNKSLKVLLVEDDVICRQIESKILKECNCEVDTAKTAEEAFNRINALHVDLMQPPYDFIFMDIGLPDIAGDFVTEMIQKTDIWKKPTPIIAVTQYHRPEDKKRFLEKGISFVITKPLTMDALKEVFQKYSS